MTSSSASASLSEFDDDSLLGDDGFQDQDSSNEVHLKIIEQPCKYFRFRYASEMNGTHGFITGRNVTQHGVKTYPSVQLCNYSGPAMIKCSLAQWDSEHEHVHTLAKEVSMANVGPDLGYAVIFQNLCIIQRTQSEVKQILGNNTNIVKKDRKQTKKSSIGIELNKVRLKFSAYNFKDAGMPLCPPVLSDVIYSQKHASTKNLKICRLSRTSGSALGGDEIFILVEKVVKDQIGVRMVKYNKYKKTSWRAECIFNEQDVHYQYAIVVKTPPYEDTSIVKDVDVFIELYRKNSSERSERLKFTYTPEFRSVSYSSITDNGHYVNIMDPTSVKTKYIDKILNVNPTPLIAGFSESRNPSNQLAFSEDFRGPQQLMDAGEFDVPCNTEEFMRFNDMLPHMKDYLVDLGLDITEDSIMDMDLGELSADGVKRKSRTFKVTSEEVSSRSKTTADNRSNLSSKNASPESIFENSDEKEAEIPTNNTQLKLIAKADGIAMKSRSSGTSIVTVKVENTSDVDIEEASLSSFEESEIPTTSFHSTSSHEVNKASALKKDAISNNKMEQIKINNAETDENIDSDVREIDARLLDVIAKDNEALLEDLLDEGLSPSVCDNNGNNAVHCAVNSKSCLPVLLKVCQRKIVEAINERNHEGKTPLHLAVLQNSPMKVKLLLSNSAKHDAVDNDGKTALHLAAERGNLEVVETLLESVQVDVDMVDGKGQTALQLVCALEDTHKNRAIIELLLEKGADVTAKVADSLSAIHLTKDKPEMMRILQTYL